MDRYSTIRGTIASGAEMRLAESDGLAAFLQSQGALDANSVLQIVDSQLRGFDRLAGYETEMQNQKPVAVRYAPMHLYKMRGMEQIRPFCALSVNGVENREDRISQYSQTFIFSHQQALQGKDGYNYLDMLFGTELLSWKTLELYRKGQARLDCDSPLKEITPRIDARDLIVTLKIVEAIYKKKNVVIQIEPNLSFNDRAMSLLAGIYSLLHPRLAIEVGYATYQRAADITKIVERNSIRIFVLPAGEPLGQMPDSFLILDMAKSQPPIQKTPLTETLAQWVQIPWEQRQIAMQNLFREDRNYQDEELFVQKSAECFNAMRSVERWNRDSSKNGTFSSVEELYAEYNAQPGQYVPWFEQMFRDKIGMLIGKQSTIDKLNAQTAVKLLTATGEEQQNVRKMYLFGRKFGNVDVGELCRLVSANQKLEDEKAHAAEVNRLNADLENEKRSAAETLLRAKTEMAAALAAERENTYKAVENGHIAVAEEKKFAAAALAAERENTRKAIADGKAAVDAANAGAEKALVQEREIAERALEAEKANTRRAVEDGEAAVAAEREKTAAAQQEKVQLRAKAIAALDEEKKRTTEARAALEQEQELHRQTREKAQALVDQNKSLQRTLSRERKNVEDLNADLANIRQERDAARAKISEAENQTSLALNAKNAMQKEQQLALAKAAETEQRLDNYKRGKYNKKLIAIAGIAGLLAGALVVGIIWLCVFLQGKNEDSFALPPAETVATSETTKATTETQTVETTREPQIPTTETTAPVVNERIDFSAFAQLTMQVPALKKVEMRNLEPWIPETFPQESGYQILALLTTAENVTEDAGAVDVPYALLIQRDAATGDVSGALDNIPADLKISTEQYTLLAFGDENMQCAAIEAFDCLFPDEMPIDIKWGSNFSLDLSDLVLELLDEADWWRKLDVFSLDAQNVNPLVAIEGITQQPVLCLCSGGQWVYVYDCTDTTEQASRLCALAESEGYHFAQQGDFVGLAVT